METDLKTQSTIDLRKFVLAFVALTLLLPISTVRATWYGERVESGADIMMMDLRWPWWPSGTYYANWNSGVKPQGGISFYAGFLGGVPDGPEGTPNPDEKLHDAYRPGSVWSFWGGDKDGNPVRFVDVAPNLCFKNAYGGEGCNASLHSESWDFIQHKRWYTMVARVWQPTDPKANHSFIGRWIKDVENNRWHLIGIARLPVRAESFTGNSGFIETLSDVNVGGDLFAFPEAKHLEWLRPFTAVYGACKTKYDCCNAKNISCAVALCRPGHSLPVCGSGNGPTTAQRAGFGRVESR